MSVLAVSAIRQRIATAISTALGATGWRETTGVYDTFGSIDGEGRLHKSYAVGVPGTAWMKDRQRLIEGALSETDLRVKWAYNLATKDQLVSYDAGLDAEQAILAAVMTCQAANDLHVTYQNSNRTVDDQGWMMGELTFKGMHNQPLS